jgi:hypothetical protein
MMIRTGRVWVGGIEGLEAEFRVRLRKGLVHRDLAFTEAGIAYGAGTVLVPLRRSNKGRATFDLSDEERILALLGATFGRAVHPEVLDTLSYAAKIWAEELAPMPDTGNKLLAETALHLVAIYPQTFTLGDGLPVNRLGQREQDELNRRFPWNGGLLRLQYETQAYSLFLADRLIASGYAPRELGRALGFELPFNLKKFNPEQPRDDHDKWSSGGGGGEDEDSEFLAREAKAILAAWAKHQHVSQFHKDMLITEKGLVLGAECVLVKSKPHETGRENLHLEDEQRILALLSTAYGRPVELDVIAKIRLAVELCNGGEKGRAAFHLAFAGLPCCTREEGFHLFVADKFMERGLTPAELMKAQGFDPAPLALLKFNPDQLRWPAGSGEDSGRWRPQGSGSRTSEESANIYPIAWRGKDKRRNRHGHQGNLSELFHDVWEWLKLKLKAAESESIEDVKQPQREAAKPRSTSLKTPEAEPTQILKPSDFVGHDFGKLGVAVEKPDITVREYNQHAVERINQRGLSQADIENTLADPLIVLQQTEDKYYYLSDKAAVAITRAGQVITTYPASNFNDDVKELLEHIHTGAKK